MPHTDIQAFRAVDQFQEFKDIVLIIQRLANAHENDVGDIQSAVQLGKKHLIQYFRRCQVSYLAGNCAGAECAAHTAPNLRGEAHRIAVVVTHQHRLNAVAVAKAPQVLYGAVVAGYLLTLHSRNRDIAALCQLLPQRFTKIGHVLKGGDTTVQPCKDLLAAKGRFSHVPQQLRDLLSVQRFDVCHRQFLIPASAGGRCKSRLSPIAAATMSSGRRIRRWVQAAQRVTAGIPGAPSKTMSRPPDFPQARQCR